MSRIDRLSIQGIRNFIPDQPEIIEFQPPITLILGRNGSGKTTIIESLKYATTGETPAGTNRGQSFIYDPKLTAKDMSIGNVKLQFYDNQGNGYVISRSMEARIVKKKVEFKTTDATISQILKDGSFKSMKIKHHDLVTFVCSALGASKALLNNVLFCHQEDCNWPLDEGKKVKDKFDEIFHTTRYVRCQDEVRKQIQDIKTELKDIEKTIEYFKVLKNQSENFLEEHHTFCARKIQLEEEMGQLAKSMNDVEEKLESCVQRVREANDIEENICKNKDRLEEVKRNIEELDVTRIIDCSATELEREILNFELTKKQSENRLNSMECQHQKIEDDLRTSLALQQQQMLELGKLQLEEEQHLTTIKKRDRLLITAADRFGWCDGSIDYHQKELSDNEVDRLRDLLEQKLIVMESDEMKLKEQLEVEENKLRETVNKTRTECSNLERDISSKEQMLTSSQKQLSEIEKQLELLEESTRHIEILEEKIQIAERTQQKIEQENNIGELQNEINQLKGKRNNYDEEIGRLRILQKKLNSQRDIQVKLEMQQKDLSSKKQLERRILSRPDVEEAIRVLLDDAKISDNILVHFNGRLKAICDHFNQQQQKLIEERNKSAALEADVRITKNQLESKQHILHEYQEKLRHSGVNGVTQLESDIDRLERELSDLEEQRGMLYGSERTVLHYIDKMEKHKENACPLCHREFDDNSEIVELVQELKTRVHLIPAKLQEFERKICEKKERHSALIELRPTAVTALKLVETDIPELERKLQSLEIQSNELKMHVQRTEDLVDSLKSKEEIGRKAHSDIVQLDNTRNEGKKLQDQMQALQNQLELAVGNTNQTVDDVQAQLQMMESCHKEVQMQIESKFLFISEQQARLVEQKHILNELSEQKLKLASNLQQRTNVDNRRKDLINSIEELKVTLRNFRLQLQPFVFQYESAKIEIGNFQSDKCAKLSFARAQVEELQNIRQEYDVLEQHIRKWISQHKSEKLIKHKEKCEELKTQHSILETEKKNLKEIIDNLKFALINCENEERNLRNNLKLLSYRLEERTIIESQRKLTDIFKSYDIDELRLEQKNLLGKLESYKIEAGEKRGILKEIVSTIETLTKKLSQDDLSKAEERYFSKVTEFEIKAVLVEDLSNFYNALEWALMRFHKERMTIINSFVRELWRNTYKGKDIDYIEVKAEESDSKGNNNRRQYNYRVVMKKNGVEMDMRGRCSAGQKVLASLIIRMALAEAFSSKCGILSLDEPTTNLDDDNISSLSDTILELSDVISRQKHQFQLIVITHDEKFLDRMSRDKRMESYYRVERNRRNNSEISQFDVLGTELGKRPAKNMKLK